MNEEEVKLRRQKEQAFALRARKALDGNNPTVALSLIEEVAEFWPQNLITILGVIGFHSRNEPLVKKAQHLFGTQLELCSNVNALTQVALWVQNPLRKKSIPIQLQHAINRKRKNLEPNWDGTWFNGGIASTNRSCALRKKCLDEIHDANDCLIVASQSANWLPWITRYRSLGGSTESPIYVKLMVAKAVSQEKEPTPRIKGLLKKFTKMGDVSEVRRFLRNITPTHRSLKGKRNPNFELACYALYLYGECERLEHTTEDWVHIAKSALYLGQDTLARIAQRILVESRGVPNVDEVLEQLFLKNGEIQVTKFPRNDIGIQANLVWQEFYARTPVNMNAGKIFSAYSRERITS